MTRILLCIGLVLSLQSHAATLETDNYKVTITNNCPEGYVVCADITYEGVSKKSGNGITLTGTTWHSLCADGVTPCKFLGYRFENGAFKYFVHDSGLLEVTKGDETLIRETGDWQFETDELMVEIESETHQCDYNRVEYYNSGYTTEVFNVSARYDLPSCQDANLIIEIRNTEQTVIFTDSFEYKYLNYYDAENTPGKHYADKKISELTTPVSWPDYRFSNIEGGVSCSEALEITHPRTDIPETEKWDLLNELEYECEVSPTFTITEATYRRLKSSNANLYCVSLVESGYLLIRDDKTQKMIAISEGC